MELILRDDIEQLGRRGEVVNVAAGYGRNYLLPRGLAPSSASWLPGRWARTRCCTAR